MSKAMFFNVPAHGHINPTLPLVRELVKRGDKVIYYATEEFKGKIEETGSLFQAYGLPNDKNYHPAANILMLAEMLLDTTSELLPQLVKVVQDEHVDYIIHDSMCLWGRVVARVLNLPAICSTSTFAMNRSVVNSMYRHSPEGIKNFLRAVFTSSLSLFRTRYKMNRLAKEYGVEISLVSIFSNPSDLNIVYTSKELQPYAESFDERYCFVGPSISFRKESADFPLHKLENRTVIYVSLGTVRNNRFDFYRECISQLGNTEYLIVISVGRNMNTTDLGELPENVLVYNHVPQLKVLQMAKGFISHGGMNSVQEGLYFGVPLLLFPQTEEQELVARRVEAFGAGRVIKERDLESAKLLGIVNMFLDDESYLQSTQKLQKSLHSSGGYKRAADKIEEFKGIYIR